MKEQFTFETEPFEVDSEAQGVSRSGRWIRQGRNIVVLIDDRTLPDDSEIYEVPAGSIPSRKDLIDPRIDFHAQEALHRMFKGDPGARADAAQMFAAVKAGRLAGIYIVDQLVPAKRAERMGLGWWQLIPKGEDATLIRDPDPSVAPLIVFRDVVRSNPNRLDPALRKAWSQARVSSIPRCPTTPTRNTALIAWLQQSLNQILGINLPIDGVFSPMTRSAVSLFQARSVLPSSGTLNRTTQKALIAGGAPIAPCMIDSPPLSGKIPDIEPSGREVLPFGADVKKVLSTSTRPNVVEMGKLGAHHYDGDPSEINGLVYTCRGGFIDLSRLRDTADLTAYLAIQALGKSSKGGTLQLSDQGGSRTVRFIKLAQFDDPEDICIDLGQRIAYELAIWHEIVRWFPDPGFPLPLERHTSFAPSNNFSNVVGTVLGAAALRDPRPYEKALELRINNALFLYHALPVAGTRAAFRRIDIQSGGLWWDSSREEDEEELLRRRHMDALPSVVPWQVSPKAVGCDPNITAKGARIEMPEKTESLRRFYELKIFVDTTRVPTSVLPNPSLPIIATDDLPIVLAKVRKDVLQTVGPRADQPD